MAPTCPSMRLLPLLPVLLLFLLATRPASSRVVGAAVIPHGDFTFDPSLVHFKNGSKELHAAAIGAGKAISALRPELIFLTTPHGMALERDFAVYENSNASGFASIGQDLHNASFPQYRVQLRRPGDKGLATDLARHLEEAMGANVSGLLNFADSEPAALRWGEVVPLSFLNESKDVPTVVWSMPLRR